jgi:hypothetical protein
MEAYLSKYATAPLIIFGNILDTIGKRFAMPIRSTAIARKLPMATKKDFFITLIFIVMKVILVRE